VALPPERGSNVTIPGVTATSDLRLPLLGARALRSLSTAAAASAAWLVRNSIAIITVIVSAPVYAFFSIWIHVRYQSNAFDLGIFAQGVKGYAEGRGPIAEIKGPGFSLLGDHFSPITALLAPFYLVFPTVIVLLVGQAFLIALGAAPLVAWARRALGRWQAIAVGFVFAASFGIASAVAFDFHEVAFAVPLLSFSLTSIARGRYRAAAMWAVPLVLVKEDLGITVAAIGAVLLLRRKWRLGAVTAAFGIFATFVEVRFLIPLANPSGEYAYSNQSSGFTLSAFIHQSPEVLNLKIATLVLTLSVGLFIPTRSTLFLVATPTLLWRFVGSNYGYWTTNYQYSLVLMPILVAAFVEVLAREKVRAGGAGFVRWALLASVAVTAVVALAFPIGTMLRASFWSVDPRLAAKQAAIAVVPSDVTVAASNHLVPQLVDADTVTLFSGTSLTNEHPNWIVADLTEGWPDSSDQRRANVQSALAHGYREVYSQNDVVVLRKAANG
jgi:uncharacterized membrane protein